MSIAVLLVIIPIACALSCSITEITKAVFNSLGVKVACNIQALISSVITAFIVVFALGGTLGFVSAIDFIVYGISTAFIIWIGSMVGYDKILQLIDQIKNIKEA